MPSCAVCQTPFTKERRGLKCTLCDERRVAEPAHYCDKACQKRHWREHKAFHARLEIEGQRMRENVSVRDVPEKFSAIAALPGNDFEVLQMRICAYQRTPVKLFPVDDLRQVLRDVRANLASLNEGNRLHEQYSRFAAELEAEIRKRIAADCLAALKLADD